MRLARLFASATLLAGLPAAALGQSTGFAPAIEANPVTVPVLTDAYVSGLIRSLDSLIALKPDTSTLRKGAGLHFWRFMSRLQSGQMSSAQEEMVIAYLDKLDKRYPTPVDREYLEVNRGMVRHMMVGKVAPDIIGKDYDGVEFKLSDYRGKVVVLYFTGQWCGPCRSEYPYERLMLEIHKDKPFAIVSVNSDASVDTAKKAKIDHKLDFRSWWDGYLEKNTGGPIATAWNVTGWPDIYVIDAKGVIRFANLRGDEILKPVRQLLEEQRKETAAAKKK
jgi:peroxiredoxin